LTEKISTSDIDKIEISNQKKKINDLDKELFMLGNKLK